SKNLVLLKALAAETDKVHVLLRFDENPGPEKQAEIATRGLQILHYLPEGAFLAAVPRSISTRELQAAGVQWIGAVYPEDKFPPRIQTSGIGSWAVRAGNTADLRIKY